MTTEIRDYMAAAQAVINQAVQDAQTSDPDDFAALAGVMRAGGLLRLNTTFAPLTGLALLQIEVVEPNGQAHTLMQCNLERFALQ